MSGNAPESIGSDRQLFIDDFWIRAARGIQRRLHSPERREIAIAADRPWEAKGISYMVTFRDGDRYRAWYRVDSPPTGESSVDRSHWVDRQTDRRDMTAYAESSDGIHWDKPSLGLIEWNGSRDNNLVWDGPGRRMAPFRDGDPAVPDDERYKAIVVHGGICVLGSPDGLKWRMLAEEPVLTRPPEEWIAFDSHNIAFQDPWTGQYVAYVRGMVGGYERHTGTRWIRRSTSPDFRTWSRPVDIDIGEPPPYHLYTSACVPYERAPGTYLMFPSRYIPERKPRPDWPRVGVNDIIFLASRDGLRFDHAFKEAFVRPGLDQDLWHERALYMERGILETSPTELSMYGMENWFGIRRYALRTDGFVSVNAGYAGGEFTTPPLTFTGTELQVNFSTSAVGYLKAEVQDAEGAPVPGLELGKCPEVFGDEIDRVICWENGERALDRLQGRPVRLRFVLADCDLYAFRFR
jgi:hypothetical protein